MKHKMIHSCIQCIQKGLGVGQVQSYKRKITYFNQFHNGNVGSTAGFLKLEIRGDKVKIIINIQEPPGLPYKRALLYLYHEAGDHLAAIQVDEIESVNGILTYQARKEWQQLYDTGRDLYTFDGMAVVYNDSHYYIGDFQDKSRKDYELVRKENRKPAVVETAGLFEETSRSSGKKRTAAQVSKEMAMEISDEFSEEKMIAETETGWQNRNGTERHNERKARQQDENGIEQQSGNRTGQQDENGIEQQSENRDKQQNQNETIEATDNAYTKCEDCPYHKKRMERNEERDTFEKMLAEYPKLPMYGANELFQCVRIHPKDIGKLDMRNWKLGVNSFLTHGFYTYQYLLLGKMRFDDGSEHPIIGVPGVFSNREKYLANMFGFEQFIPVKKTGIKTGEFGYWIVEVN